ncbi:SDR family NAD(P)-dependent oxidoreductase [Methylocystis iwaonis]|uniref:3-oxoacyl-ACP reductase n=1 Tax=Methylocystis iwaonis TaxID=2885079 RepID=A0ABN6VF10_9HYPH|nr:SDR family NAD(P)-dependent oxidoreductase [Methylocystis iwaonis]BDV33799.1 3-oxoacyl-ACP reductase [Methylocystis iwaonis]
MRRNVIVTGGSRGLGLAISRRLVADGFRVIAVARKPSDALDEEIARASGALAFAALDLSQIDAIADFVLRLKKEFGAPYGLVNNAGLGTEGLLATMHNSQIDQLTRVNVTAPIVLTKYVVRNMMSAGQGGRIVNMSSIIASTGYNALSVYGATKAALIGFTKSLSREVGRMGVTVNAVAPGFIETEMTASLGEEERAKIAARAALRRLAAPEDVANAVSYLLDDKARNITGTVMTVDAGATA